MTFASKTEIPCDCGYLDDAAKNPEHPIEFDARLNEFSIVHGKSRFLIHHCPFCGGAAPASLRATLFAHVTHDEQRRVLGLTRDLRRVEDVIAKLGPPSREVPFGLVTARPECDGGAPSFQAVRVLVYSELSATAELQIQVGSDGRLVFSLTAKYVGPPKT
jgi:hypothetical protein